MRHRSSRYDIRAFESALREMKDNGLKDFSAAYLNQLAVKRDQYLARLTTTQGSR